MYIEAGVQTAISHEKVKNDYMLRLVFKPPLAIKKVNDCSLRLVFKPPLAMRK